MNKKFASLGTALSRDEAKKVMGGLRDGNGTVCASCGTSSICGSSTSCSHSATNSCCIVCNGVETCA